MFWAVLTDRGGFLRRLAWREGETVTVVVIGGADAAATPVEDDEIAHCWRWECVNWFLNGAGWLKYGLVVVRWVS